MMANNDYYSTTNATMRRDDDIEECDDGDDGPGIIVIGRRRRKNNNILLILLCLLAASSLLIGVGIGAADRWTEGGDDDDGVAFVVVTSSSLATTTTPPPTAPPPTAPTASTTASTSSMMYCRRKLDLPVSRPYNTQIDVHGKHMIIVTRETKTTNVHVIFYTRTNDDDDEDGGTTGIGTTLWNYVEDNHFILDHGSRMDDKDNNDHDDDDSDDLALEKISVSLSDTSALVGLPYTNFTNSVLDTGFVYIFERTDQTAADDDDDDDDIVIWKKIDTTLQPTNDVIDTMSWYLNETVRYFYFGSSIDIVDDIACVVSDYSPNGWGEPKVYVYQRSIDNDGTSWKQIRKLELNYPPSAKECYVGDIDTLAVQVDDYTVELFKYDDYDGKYKLLQTKIKNDWMEAVSFDNEYLIYSTKKEYDIYTEYDCYETSAFTIYRRQEDHQPYILQQTINVSESSRCAPEFHSGLQRSLFHIERTGYESSIYHDDDMLVVRGDDRSIVYLKNDVGYWDEALTLNGGVYRGYHVSEQQLLAISYTLVSDEDEIYYFDLSKVYSSSSSSSSNNNVIVNVEDCVSPPTQMPTLSISPSILTPTPTYGGTYGGTSIAGGLYRTQYPTFNTIRCQDPWLNLDTSSTLLTQSYVPPESCDYSLDIVIAFDDNPSSMSWDVQLVDDAGGSDNVVVKVYKGVPNDAYQLRNESLCVDEGVYVFNIYGKGGIKYPGYYDVRVLGELVTRGDEFDCSATVTFAIPFTGVAVPPVVVTMPSMTIEPSLNIVSSTLYPSALTVSTELPTTSTCTVVDISVTFDDFPEEISWAVQKLNTIGTNNVLKVFNGTLDVDVQQKRKETLCLSDGSYRFTIYDSAGDGLYDPGTYKVTTTNGVVIARNNSFDSFEDTTLFSIPMN